MQQEKIAEISKDILIALMGNKTFLKDHVIAKDEGLNETVIKDFARLYQSLYTELDSFFKKTT